MIACALAWAQAVALVHGIAHPARLHASAGLDAPQAPHASHAAAHAHPHASSPARDDGAASVVRGAPAWPVSWVHALFASHDDDSPTCRLLDSLSHGAPPAAAAAALPAVLPAYLLPLWAGEALARWVALFDARGPPSPLVR